MTSKQYIINGIPVESIKMVHKCELTGRRTYAAFLANNETALVTAFTRREALAKWNAVEVDGEEV